MPSKSQAQHRFFAAAATNPSFAKKAGIKPSVAADFMHADKGRVASLPARVAPKPKAASMSRAQAQRMDARLDRQLGESEKGEPARVAPKPKGSAMAALRQLRGR